MGPGSTPEDAVKAWYSEVKYYTDYKHGTFRSQTGHFTQVVWKGTTKVGLAVSDCGKYIVANYKCPGNMMGDFAKNVLPPGSVTGSSNGAGGAPCVNGCG